MVFPNALTIISPFFLIDSLRHCKKKKKKSSKNLESGYYLYLYLAANKAEEKSAV